MTRFVKVLLSACAIACLVTAPRPALAASNGVRLEVVSAAGADRVSWSGTIRSDSRWRLVSAASAGGPFTKVGEYDRRRTTVMVAVATPGYRFYRVEVLRGGRRPVKVAESAVAVNDRVRASAVIGPDGGALVSSNGEFALRVPPGALTANTTLVCSETPAPTLAGAISMADTFDLLPSGTRFLVPAEVTMRYRVPVSHFQVASKLLDAVELVGRDGAGTWERVSVTVDRSLGTFTGKLGHFSYWSGAVIQPHGTTPAKTSYCSGVCHDLLDAPGSSRVIPSRDPQVCYNCHGNTSAALPPAGATGPNVQAEFRAVVGQTIEASSSRHPVGGGAGKMACTQCHDPHRDPSGAPGLLRVYDPLGRALEQKAGQSLGSEFCWACHGTAVNAKTNRSVPGYYANSSGDKKSAYLATAHGGGRSSMQRYDTAADFVKGGTTAVTVASTGTVVLPTSAITLPKNVTPVFSRGASSGQPQNVASVLYDGDTTDYLTWYTPADLGATAANGYVGTLTVTFDLGEACRVEGVSLNALYATDSPDRMELWTSADGTNWTKTASKGVLGVRLAAYELLPGTADARYVRLTLVRVFNGGSGSLYLTECDLIARPRAGVWQGDFDVSRASTVASNALAWDAGVSALTSMTVETRIAIGSGIWSPWTAAVNGAPVSMLTTGTSLDKTLVQVRAKLHRDDFSQTPELRSMQLTLGRAALPNVATVYPGSGVTTAACGNCHVPHGGPNAALGRANGNELCYGCHTQAVGSYYGKAGFTGAVHETVGCASCHRPHGSMNGTSAAFAFGLDAQRTAQCDACHSVGARFTAGAGPLKEWTRHDVFAVDKTKTDSTMECRKCHSPHSKTTLVDAVYGGSFAYMRDDPTSFPTGEVVLYPVADTVIDSLNPTWNYGSSPTANLVSTNALLMKFDLSQIPAGATIQNAEFVLWTTVSPGAAGFWVSALTRDWQEGTAVGATNTAGINGATWLERRYGDNAWTGDTASGDWGVRGGDGSAEIGQRTGESVTNITSGLTTIRHSGQDFGLLVKPLGSGTLSTYLREHATVQYRPKLRVTYRTGPASRQVLDDVGFCLRCHSGTMPTGVRGQTLLDIAYAYSRTAHGSGKGYGPESQPYNRDRGGGGLRAPYTYGMDPLPCVTCHDPHGSSNPYHLRESLNGFDTRFTPSGYVTYDRQNAYTNITTFCRACHIYPPNHGSAFGVGGCKPCHGHGGSRG